MPKQRQVRRSYERAETRLDFNPLITRGCTVVLLSGWRAETFGGRAVKLAGPRIESRRRLPEPPGRIVAEAADLLGFDPPPQVSRSERDPEWAETGL